MTQYFQDVNNDLEAMERSKEFISIIEALVIEAFKKNNQMNMSTQRISKIYIYNKPFLFYLKKYIYIQKYEEIQRLLSILKAQPQVKMVLSKANQLEYKTVLIQDTLEYGAKCQKHWIFLDPIFTSEDIQKKLAKEAQFFEMLINHLKCL